VRLNGIFLFLVLSGCTSTSSRVDYNHHLGLWDLVADYCDETYELKANGTQIVISKPEVNVDKYTFEEFGDTGFYAWEYTVVEYNGKPSCNGTYDTYMGEQTLAFVKFKNNFTEMHLYAWPNEESNLGGYLKRR